MASTGHKPRSLDEEEDPGIEHISNEETGAQDANESTTLTSTTFPTTDDGTEENGLKRKSNLSSWVWEPFTKVCDTKKNEKAKCNYCGAQYACGSKKNGTSNLGHHIRFQCRSMRGLWQLTRSKKQYVLK
ncbi:hypothetical protein CsatB_000930 [Cannabis sativa]|uniref:uncharacterized protein LOC115698054 n=1 Tax=Cannabis sativa TaxID=3483 RepID=UPI0029CA8F82|nr:uncharacterized protein LOC115698054 [Cannabis sativa]